jgi:uncharacterized protein YfaT (DUF1175 family)
MDELIDEFGVDGAIEYINSCGGNKSKESKKQKQEMIVIRSCCFVCKYLIFHKTKSGKRSFKCRKTNKQVIYQYKIPKWCPGFKINPNLG